MDDMNLANNASGWALTLDSDDLTYSTADISTATLQFDIINGPHTGDPPYSPPGEGGGDWLPPPGSSDIEILDTSLITAIVNDYARATLRIELKGGEEKFLFSGGALVDHFGALVTNAATWLSFPADGYGSDFPTVTSATVTASDNKHLTIEALWYPIKGTTKTKVRVDVPPEVLTYSLDALWDTETYTILTSAPVASIMPAAGANVADGKLSGLGGQTLSWNVDLTVGGGATFVNMTMPPSAAEVLGWFNFPTSSWPAITVEENSIHADETSPAVILHFTLKSPALTEEQRGQVNGNTGWTVTIPDAWLVQNMPSGLTTTNTVKFAILPAAWNPPTPPGPGGPEVAPGGGDASKVWVKVTQNTINAVIGSTAAGSITLQLMNGEKFLHDGTDLKTHAGATVSIANSTES
jgi:hypothetical protein